MIDVVQLAEFIESKLNSNSQSLVFRTYTFEKTLDQRYETTNGVKSNFIPSIITTPMGSYLPINNLRGSRQSFNLEIMLPLTDKYNWINMVNDFVWSVNGKVFYLNSTGILENAPAKPYTTLKMTCQVPSFGAVTAQNFELISQIASYLPIKVTENYVGITIPISLKTIDAVIVGDQVGVYLAVVNTNGWEPSNLTAYNAAPTGTKLQIYSATFSSAANMSQWLDANHPQSQEWTVAQGSNSPGTVTYYCYNPAHKLNHEYTRIKAPDYSVKNTRVPITEQFEGDATGETFISQNDSKFIMTAYYEDNTLMNRIIDNIHDGTEQNLNLWLKVVYPHTTKYDKVIIYDQSAIFAIDDYAIIPLTLVRAWSK